MTKKEKVAPKRQYIKPPRARKAIPMKKSSFLLPSVLPQLLIIAVCIGIYYAMIYFYLFFEWGIYIYYAIKLVIAFEILSAAVKSVFVPLAALILALAVLFTNCNFLNTLMNTDTAWQLSAVALAGILIAALVEYRSRHL